MNRWSWGLLLLLGCGTTEYYDLTTTLVSVPVVINQDSQYLSEADNPGTPDVDETEYTDLSKSWFKTAIKLKNDGQDTIAIAGLKFKISVPSTSSEIGYADSTCEISTLVEESVTASGTVSTVTLPTIIAIGKSKTFDSLYCSGLPFAEDETNFVAPVELTVSGWKSDEDGNALDRLPVKTYKFKTK